MNSHQIQQRITNLENDALFLTLSGDPGYRIDIKRIEDEIKRLESQLEEDNEHGN